MVALPVIHDIYSPRDWPQYINTWGTTFLLGPFLFPALAGYILEATNSWRDCFKALVGLYSGSTILLLIFAYETYHDGSDTFKSACRAGAFIGIGNTRLPKRHTLYTSTVCLARLIFSPPLIYIGILTMVSFTWPIGISTTVDAIVRAPPYQFGNVAAASIRFAGVIGALLGYVVGHLFNRWIFNGSGGKRKSNWRSEYRLHGVWLPIVSMAVGLLIYGLTLHYDRSWVGLAAGWVLVNIGLVGSTV